jgi:L-lactate dehydrogenase
VAGSTLGESSEQHVQWESTIHEEVVDSAYKIVRLKGSPSWANALSATAIISAIMRNSREVFALSTNCKGIHAIAEDVYLSLPCVVGANGLTHVVKQQLREGEMAQLKRSAEKLWELQKGLLI